MNQIKSHTQSGVNLLDDAEIALDKLVNREVKLIKETEELFMHQVDHMKLVDQLRRYAPNMDKVDMDTKRLSTLVDKSSTLVEEVCGTIRRIDTAKSRLEDSLSKVSDVLDLSTCLDGLRDAMKANDYEMAAIHIKKYLSIDHEELMKTVNIISNLDERQRDLKLPSQDEEPPKRASLSADDKAITDPTFISRAFGHLDSAHKSLVETCNQRFGQAVSSKNSDDIERFFKLFPMLNEHQSGLSRYAIHLKSLIVTPQLDGTLKSKQTTQADKLATLYETIAKLIDCHRPQIETYYGPGYLIVVIKVLQLECDRLSRHVLVEFITQMNLQSVLKEVKNSLMQAANQVAHPAQIQQLGSTTTKLDLRNVDNILNQISIIISRTDVYIDFIVRLIKDDIKSKSDDEKDHTKRLNELNNLIRNECDLAHLSQEVGGYYVMLEQFYLNESAKKAILMDQVDIESSKCYTSSILDDTFFLIKKCTKRAISTKSNDLFCAIINHCVALLESTFRRFLEERLSNQQYYPFGFTKPSLDLTEAYNVIQSGRYLQSSNELSLAKAHYFAAINNLDKACDYINRLREMLDIDIKKLKPALSVLHEGRYNPLEKSVSCLNDLSQLVKNFSSLANSSLSQLFNTSLKQRIKTELKAVLAENPDLPSMAATEPDELTGLSKDLLISIDSSLKDHLTPENFSKLITISKDALIYSIKNM